jgi:hypothetical protein
LKFKSYHWHSLLFGKLFHLRDEGLGDGIHQCAGAELESCYFLRSTGHSLPPSQQPSSPPSIGVRLTLISNG